MNRHKENEESQKNLASASLLMNSYFNACQVMSANNKVPHANWQDIFNLEHIYKIWLSELTRNPSKICQAQFDYLHDNFKLCLSMQEASLGKKLQPLIVPAPEDKRFRSSAWGEEPYFYYLQQSYLLMVQHCMRFIQDNKSSNPKIARQVDFFTRQFLDALSPSNYIFTNPDVIKHIIDTKGESLFKGYQNFLDDVIDGGGQFAIKMTDMSAFEIGKNLAITPGKVIFQNKLFQLIQYTPTTTKVYQRPLLIIPPWINKYYILDLNQKNSYVKWIVDQGFTVFMISWANPDENYREITFDDYVTEGVLPALDAITQATGEQQVNALGFCIGGTLLATTLAYMKAKHDNRIVSSTFLATLIDFTDPGEIEVFIDEPQLSALEQKMHKDGYLDGRVLMTTFNMLRANDLFWSYYIHNYLCGKAPHAFDIFYWNTDSVNLPEKMLSFYLRNLYLNNFLIQKDRLKINGVNIDVSLIDIPAYFLSTEQDHIAPWQSIFMGAVFLNSPTTFVLGGSGHIAGVINPPSSQKYSYHFSDRDIKQFETPDEWRANTQTATGSWWNHWVTWLTKSAGKKIEPRCPGSGKLPILQDAPGDYVKKRSH